jgi:CRP-like cAMP-binding protein
VIDRLRRQIQEYLDELLAEAKRLRKALTALKPGSTKAPARKPRQRKPAEATATPKTKAMAPEPVPVTRTSQPSARASRRTAPGATKAAVLAALDGGEPMTAGEVAAKAGLARPTVSTTLTRLAKSGEVQKVKRGYRLTPSPPETPPSSAE